MHRPECPSLSKEVVHSAPAQPAVAGDSARSFAAYYPRVYRYAYLVRLDRAAGAGKSLYALMLRAEAGIDGPNAAERDELVFTWAHDEIQLSGRRHIRKKRPLQISAAQPLGCSWRWLRADLMEWRRAASTRDLHRRVLVEVEHLEPEIANRISKRPLRRHSTGPWIHASISRLRRLLRHNETTR